LSEGRQGCLIYLYTGEGGGKTTNALGLALRSAGHGLKVIVIQFMKGRKNIGEYKIRARLAPEYEIHQFGRSGWVDLKSPGPVDIKLAQKGLDFARQAAKRRPALLVLDEINLAVAVGLLKPKDVLDLLDEVPKRTVVVLTGRRAPKELLDRADFVNEIVDVKHPSEIPTRRGIQF